MMSAQEIVSNEALNDLSDYFHAAPIALHVADPDGIISRTNLAELELLGFSDCPDEYVGHHLAEFHDDTDALRELLDRLIAGETIVEYESSLVRRDGKRQRVLLYANGRFDENGFNGVRCFTFPHPDDLRPEIAELGALRDESIERRQLDLTAEERDRLYRELQDFFDNSPIGLHIVGGDGLIKRASKTELANMGYESEAYIGQHIARFHADQKVIDGMLEDLVGGTPLINFPATLSKSDGSKFPVMIYSNSRMYEGSFLNTRCFTVPLPKSRRAQKKAMEFSWPRNEDFGFTIPGRVEPNAQAKPNPMTVALKYIASRKRPEESLGFLAEVSKILSSKRPFADMLGEVLSISVPFLADFASVEDASGHLAHAGSDNLESRADEIIQQLSANGSDNQPRLGPGIRSPLNAPLTIRGESVGTLTLLREDVPTRRDFGPADQALAEELARRISFALEIERLCRAT
jgi:PAS domain S-box-containing protein